MRLVVNQPNPWVSDPRYRNGMLVFLVALLAFDVRLWVVWSQPNILEPLTITALCALVLINHINVSFLSAKTQLRLRRPLMLLAGLVFGLTMTWWITVFLK
jgi:hypothetical protein